MAGGPVARPYAEAMIEIGVEKGLLDTFRENLDFIADTVLADSDFRAFYESPRIDREVKRKLVVGALGQQLHEHVVSLLEMLIEKGRQFALPAIIDQFRELHDEKAGRVSVQVFTARPLESAGAANLASRLTGILKKEIRLQEEVDATLLGGVVLHVGDTVVDGSLKRRLDTLDRKMRSSGKLNGEGIYED